MDIILQYIGIFASVLSLPLSILFFIRTCEARQNRVRLEIIRTISYSFGDGTPLELADVTAIYKSKVRENNVHKPQFTEEMILEDIISDVSSNPYLKHEDKIRIINEVRALLNGNLLIFGVSNTSVIKNNQAFAQMTKPIIQHPSSVSSQNKKRTSVLLDRRGLLVIIILILISTVLLVMKPFACESSNNQTYYPILTATIYPDQTPTPALQQTPVATSKPMATPVAEQPTKITRNPVYTVVSLILVSSSIVITIFSAFFDRLKSFKRKR